VIALLNRTIYCAQALLGTDQELVRWRSCVNFINQNMGVAIGRMYVEQYFSRDSRENVSTENTNRTLCELNVLLGTLIISHENIGNTRFNKFHSTVTSRMRIGPNFYSNNVWATYTCSP